MLNLSSIRKFGSVLALALTVPALATAGFTATAMATDLNYSQPGAGEQGHFVRIGLNKSVVIKLPAEARDVIVGNPAIVDAVVRTKTTAYLFAKAVGQTNIFFFDDKGHQIMNVDLEVALDMTALQNLIDRTIPNSKITVDTVNGSVVLGGTADNAVDAKLATDLAARFTSDPNLVVDAMKISGGDQVMLKVRVVEIQRDVLKQLGINIDKLAFDVGKFAFDMSSLNPIGAIYGRATGTFNSGSLDISSSIQAMESDGVLHTLAEPTLTAVSGQIANFHAGGQFPYVSGVSCDSSGKNCVNTITYKDFGVKLGFTPEVLSEGRISLKINTEVSELSDSTTGALNTRSADTTIELPSGGSMMLAGLIKDVSDQQIRGTPGLKNLPVLGALFRSRSYASNQTELVVIVTPYIVHPVAEKELMTPGDRFNVATDRQAIIFGRLNQVYGAPGRKPQGIYHGNIGYIIE
jgi:pilus assembly protein CpaC